MTQEIQGPADRSRIDVTDPAEVKWWSRALGCSSEQLLEAVASAGGSAAEVERLLDEQNGFRTSCNRVADSQD